MRVACRAASAVVIGCVIAGGVGAAQRTARALEGWVKAPAEGAAETAAFVAIENGTMYDIYLVGAESDAADVVELRQAVKGGTSTVAKDVTVPAFDRLNMSPEGVYVRLGGLKRPLKPGDAVTVSILVDNSAPLSVLATVK
jgi:copper(I)-binding protein